LNLKTSGNTVLITGGGTGIGFALAQEFISRGNGVVICGRRIQRLQSAKKQLPGLQTRVCDVSKAASRKSLLEWLASSFPALNILVNNAGIQRAIDFRTGRNLPQVDAELSTNLAGPIHLSASLIPHLRKQKRSAIVNISSGLAFTPLAAVPVYCATKAAIHAFTLSLRHQLRNTSVRVFEAAPPIVRTELSGRRSRPEGDFVMSAHEVARGILEALENDTYEVALGAATHLRQQREAMFAALNES